MSEAHDDEIVRWNDKRGLAACSGHVVCLFWDRECSVTVDPEKTAVDRVLVGFPRRCQGADEAVVSFGQNPFSIPDAALKIQVAQTCPIPRRHEVITLSQKISERIGLDH